MNVIQTGPDRFEVLVTLSSGEQRTFTVPGRKLDRFAGVIDQMGADAPRIVGSPKALRAVTRDLEEEEEAAAAAAGELELEEPEEGGEMSAPSDDDIPF